MKKTTLMIGLLMLTLNTSAQTITANNISFNATYREYDYKLASLIETGADCKINSAALTVWGPDNQINEIIIKDNESTKINGYAIRYNTGYTRENTQYVEFSIRNASEAIKEKPGTMTISSKQYGIGYRNYLFKVDHLIYGQVGCIVKKAVLEIKKPDDTVIEKTIIVGDTLYYDEMEIKVIEAYQTPSSSYAKIKTTNILTCVETDNGNNTYQKGKCQDPTGTYTDVCLDDMIVEYTCINKQCKISTLRCPTGKCIDGACIGANTTTTLTTSTTTSTSTSTSSSSTTTLIEKPQLTLSAEIMIAAAVIIIILLTAAYLRNKKT